MRDTGRADELVQDASVELHHRWSILKDRSTATCYLHATVVEDGGPESITPYDLRVL